MFDFFKKKKAEKNETKVVQKNMSLRWQASRNFEKYLSDFLTSGVSNGLPAGRLTDEEWNALNQELKNVGVVLVPKPDHNGYVYYWFSKIDSKNDLSLRNRASRNFEKYLSEFLISGKSSGLPAERLTQEEWKKLNIELQKEACVRLVPRVQNGIEYYWFVKSSDIADKESVFAKGKEDLENKLIEIIQKKYPNLTTVTILNILRSENPTDESVIYNMLRYKQDGQYTDVSEQEFKDAFVYAFQSCANKDILKRMAFYNHWNPRVYENTNVLSISCRGKDWPDDRTIFMDGSQDWTWFRKCDGALLNPVHDPRNPEGFHISLNVRVTADLLKALDDILIDDGGKFIYSYKFPKTDYYDEILSRHDPVTIYTRVRNPELEKRIVLAVQPFVRSNEGMIGEELGKGVCINSETSGHGGGRSVGEEISCNIANVIREHRNRL